MSQTPTSGISPYEGTPWVDVPRSSSATVQNMLWGRQFGEQLGIGPILSFSFPELDAKWLDGYDGGRQLIHLMYP